MENRRKEDTCAGRGKNRRLLAATGLGAGATRQIQSWSEIPARKQRQERCIHLPPNTRPISPLRNKPSHLRPTAEHRTPPVKSELAFRRATKPERCRSRARQRG